MSRVHVPICAAVETRCSGCRSRINSVVHYVISCLHDKLLPCQHYQPGQGQDKHPPQHKQVAESRVVLSQSVTLLGSGSCNTPAQQAGHDMVCCGVIQQLCQLSRSIPAGLVDCVLDMDGGASVSSCLLVGGLGRVLGTSCWASSSCTT